LTLLYSLLLGGVVSALAQSQDEYVVKQGDTLLRISQSQNTTVDELLQANRLSRTTILSVGQVLKIPRAEPPVTEATAAAPEPAPVAEIPAPANVAASIESVPPEAPISVPAAEPAAAPLGGAPAAVNLPAGANAPTAASSASGVSLPVSSNTSPSTTSPPSPFSLPSVPELLAVLLLLTLGTWLIIEMRRARPRLPGRGPRDSGPNS
jgi:LysM repeat protein